MPFVSVIAFHTSVKKHDFQLIFITYNKYIHFSFCVSSSNIRRIQYEPYPINDISHKALQKTASRF